ncbi:15526_t:CDS:2 [Funneliformis mosseae]|uniref:non-specific serine/threonine protein kinase n=1 Tax=Funneliformis mosseae TaxID=27381 RepID=A0A9N8V152_FUNMO|nr:15526_t:CDS:2 [Funneliformis mosseae]
MERKLAKLIKAFSLKEPNKLQLEFKYNNERKITTLSPLSPARMSNSDTIMESSWNEHIHFKLDTLNTSGSNKLVITCWDASIKGPDGRLGEIAMDLENFDKSDEFDNKSKRSLYVVGNLFIYLLRNDEPKPKIELKFYLYFLSNRPPIEEMKMFEDLSLRNKRIGMMLIDNLEYENLCGNAGPLGFELRKEFHSTAKYWQIDSQQQEKRLEWKHPIGMFLVARPDNLVIFFKTNFNGLAKTKISIGPSGEMEFIWPRLMNGGPINVTSRHIFGKEKGKSIRQEHESAIKQNTNDTLSCSSPRESSSIPSFKDNPSDHDHIYAILQKPTPTVQRHQSLTHTNATQTKTTLVQRQRSYKDKSEQKQIEQNKRFSHSSSDTSKSSKQKTVDKRQQIRNDNLSINVHFQQEPQDYANNNAYRPKPSPTFENETRQDLSPISSISSSLSLKYPPDNKTQPLTIPNKNLSRNIEQHIKVGNSPPVSVGSQYCEHKEIPLEPKMFTQQNFQQQLPHNLTFGFNPSTFQINNSQIIFNRFEIISPLQRATTSHNKVYLGQHKFTSDQVIIKQYKSHSRWENERRFLKELKSKLIVKLEDVSINPINEQDCLIVTKYYGKPLDEVAGDIYDNKEYIKKVFYNICLAVDWCHKNGVVHMDLNPSNIICKDSLIHRIRLCDFEHAKKVGDKIYSHHNQAFIIGFTSPELFYLQRQQPVPSSLPSSYSSSSSNTPYTSQSSYLHCLSSLDIFSLGCILYYLNTKNLIFTTEKDLEQLNLTKVSESIEDKRVSILVKWMVAETGNERPDTTQLITNSFFDSIR